MALLENCSDSSLKVFGLRVVVSWPTNTWPGTSVSVVATFGMAVLKNSPPGSVVALRSCVYRPISRHLGEIM